MPQIRYTMGLKTAPKPIMSAKVPATQAGVSAKTLVSAKGFAPPGALVPPSAAPGAAAAPPGALVPPPDAAYEQTVAGLARQRDTTLAGLEQQRAGGLLQYGYKADPVTGAVTFDTTNTYGQAALLKRNYDQARTGNVNQFAARGGLYSGALQGVQDESYFKQGGAEDSLQKQLGAFLARNTQAKGTALSNWELGMGDAMGGRLDRIAANPLYDPVVADGTPDPAAAQAAMAKLGSAAPKVGGNAAQPKTATKKPAAKKVRIVMGPKTQSRPKPTPGPSRGKRR